MGGNDGWISILRIGHILSLVVAVMCNFMRVGSIINDAAMMDSRTPVEQHLILVH